MILLFALAHASSLSGVGVPGAGGVFGSPTEPGAPGLVYNPAAAHPKTFDLLVDAGLLATTYSFTLDGQETVTSKGATAVPFLAAAVPVGPVGLGVTVYVPYARGGDPYDDEGVQRYYTIAGVLRIIEVAPVASGHLYVPLPQGDHGLTLEVGAGPRIDIGTQSSRRSFDTGALLGSLLGEEAKVPLQDPFLEGTQDLPGSHGVGLGAAVGARVVHGADGSGHPDWTVAAAWHSAVHDTLHGTFRLVLSNDLAMEIDGDVETALVLPPDFNAGARVAVDPKRRWNLSGDVSWVGWSTFARIDSQLANSEIVSEDPLMEQILKSYGLTDAEFLSALTHVVTTTGMGDIWGGGVGVDGRIGKRWLPRARVGYTMAAVPSTNVHPGNVDFANVDVSLATGFRVTKTLTVAAGGDLYLCATRVITDSTLALTNEPDSGTVYPSGNGTYSLSAGRAGLSLRWSP